MYPTLTSDFWLKLSGCRARWSCTYLLCSFWVSTEKVSSLIRDAQWRVRSTDLTNRELTWISDTVCNYWCMMVGLLRLPVHDLEVGCPFCRGLDHLARETEECWYSLERLLALPAVLTDSPRAVIPQGCFCQIARLSFILWRNGAVAAPQVLRKSAAVIITKVMRGACNSYANGMSVRDYPYWRD